MGSGYQWSSPEELGGIRSSLSNYLSSQVGKEAPGYPGETGAKMPQNLMDIRGMYQTLLGGADRGSVGVDEHGFPMPATGAFPMPGVFGKTEEMLSGMMETGRPTATADWEKARKMEFEQVLEDSLNKQMAERYMTGRRWGTGTQRAIGETTGRTMLTWGTEAASRRMQAEEAARGRQMQAGGMGLNLGELLYRLPLEALGGAAGLEMGVWGQQQEQADRAYQAWLRRQPGYRPEMGQALGYATTYPGSQTMDPWLALLGGTLEAGGTAAGTAAGMALGGG